jgi:hypothetical protein
MPDGGTLRVSLSAKCFNVERAATVGAVAAPEYIIVQVVDSGNAYPGIDSRAHL